MNAPELNDDGLNAESLQRGGLFEYFEIFRRRWVIVIVAIAIVTTAGILFTKSRKKLYVATTSLVVTTDSGSKLGGAAGGESGSSLLESISALGEGRNVETQAAILQSSDLLSEAYGYLSRDEQRLGFGGDSPAPEIPKWGFDVEQKKNVDVLTVNVTSYTPKVSAKLAASIVDTYLKRDLDRNSRAAQQGRIFVYSEMQNLKDKLSEASIDLAKYSKLTGLIDPTSQIAADTKDLLEAKLALDETRVAAEAGRHEVANFEVQLKKFAPEIPVATQIEASPDFLQARARINALQGKLAEQEQLFTQTSPEIKVIKDNLAVEEENLRKLSKTYVYSETHARPPALDKVIELYATALGQMILDEEKAKGIEKFVTRREKDFEAIPEHGREYAEKKEKAETLLKAYEQLSEKYYQLLIEERSSIPSGFVVSTAMVPKKPTFPNMVTSTALSFLLGILAGIVVASLLEKFDTRIHDPALVERITGLTVLTAVPEVKVSEEVIGTLTIGSSEAPSGFAESFRLLRNNIAFSVPDQKLKIVAVTSAGKGDGKSTTSVNLAIALAMDGNRVLLIDADLRRPALHKYLGLSREVGFTNVVRGTVTMQEAILPTAFDNVSCLTTGPLPPSPSEFLNSVHARELFETATQLYDFVLVDCPPCTGLSDIQVISTVVQGIVLVVALDVTEKQYLSGAIRLLRLAGAPLLGMVLNRVRYSRSNYYYYSYYYYYGYYGEDEMENRKKSGRKAKGPKDN